MDTIYEWLIKNTGNAHLSSNAEQYFTILNVQRETNHNGISELDVMVRNRDFNVLNLLVLPATDTAPQTDERQGRTILNTYTFPDDAAVTAYLSSGHTPDSSEQDGTAQYQVLVLEPTDEAGQITFPPTATDESADA